MIHSILMGIVAGARSITPMAIVTNMARRGTLPENDLPVRLLGHPVMVAGSTVMAAGELAGDKMKTAPDRIVAPGMIARILSAGIAGAALAPKQDRLTAAAAAIGVAAISAHLTFAARMKAMERNGQTPTGVIEDTLVVGSALAIAHSAER